MAEQTIICPFCKKEIPLDESTRIMFDKEFNDLPVEFRSKLNVGNSMYEVVPSGECPSGTRGRIAVFEMFKIDKEMQSVILKSPTEAAIYKLARSKGMLMMREDAMFKSLEGTIPFTEVYNFSNQNE